ncbi:hypothetical protein [Streptomyces scopuliridis]
MSDRLLVATVVAIPQAGQFSALLPVVLAGCAVAVRTCWQRCMPGSA